MARFSIVALAALVASALAQSAQMCQPVAVGSGGSCQQPYGGFNQWTVAGDPCQGYCCPSGWQCRYNLANGANVYNRVCVAVIPAEPQVSAQPGGGGVNTNTITETRTNWHTQTVVVPGQGGGSGGGSGGGQPGGGVVYYTTVTEGPSASIGAVISTTYVADGNAATTVLTIWGGKFAWKNYVTPCGQNTDAPTAISGVWLVACSATDYNAATPGKTIFVSAWYGRILAVLTVVITAVTLWI